MYKNTPMNEDQVNMENIDLSLSFLAGFVEQQAASGKARYDSSKSMLASNIGSHVPSVGLNFKAYE